MGLLPLIVGEGITEIDVRNPGTFHADQAAIKTRVIGSKIEGLRRFGKVLVADLDNGESLIFHLKMTGQMVFDKSKVKGQRSKVRFAGGHPTNSIAADLPDGSTRVIFTFAGGDKLFYNDQRKFGWIKLAETQAVGTDPLLKRMGPEPLSSQFTLSGFKLALARHPRAPIKPVILDQSTVAGVGNIYADESLHLAKIHPQRLAGTLSVFEIKSLHQAIKNIIQLGIKHGGTSLSHYINAQGGQGDYLQSARVFRRQGQKCHECGAVIEKLRVAGRGTHICPKCQVNE